MEGLQESSTALTKVLALHLSSLPPATTAEIAPTVSRPAGVPPRRVVVVLVLPAVAAGQLHPRLYLVLFVCCQSA